MQQSETIAIRKIKGIPRTERPRCRAKTRKGSPCQAQALLDRNGQPGRCKLHGGLSTGPKTRAGKAATREASRSSMIHRWQAMKADGISRIPLTEAGRERLRQSSRRNMRMYHRRNQALRWADWLMEQSQDRTARFLYGGIQYIMIEPFREAYAHGGYKELLELASFTSLDLENLSDGTELSLMIVYHYRYDITKLADEFRTAAS